MKKELWWKFNPEKRITNPDNPITFSRPNQYFSKFDAVLDCGTLVEVWDFPSGYVQQRLSEKRCFHWNHHLNVLHRIGLSEFRDPYLRRKMITHILEFWKGYFSINFNLPILRGVPTWGLFRVLVYFLKNPGLKDRIFWYNSRDVQTMLDIYFH